MDVNLTFLNGVHEEDDFVEQPPRHIKEGQEKQVYKLNKALYGLKQAPCVWYTRIDSYLLQHGFQKIHFEHTLYIKSNSNGDIIVVCLYVDDLIFIRNCQQMFEDFRKAMKQ